MAVRSTCDRCAEEFLREANYPYVAEELDLVFCPDCGRDAEDFYGRDLDPNEVYPEMIAG